MLKLPKQKTFISLFLFVGATFFPALSYAQSLGGGVDPIQYMVAPQTPGPNENVSIEAQGVGAFLGSATITWQVNGKVMLTGIGLRDFTFTTGALGTQNHVHVTVVSPTQGTFTHDFVFVPSTINLVWEADTTVPPFYRGHSLYSAGSTLKVVAFPTIIVNGTKIAASSLSFQWSHGDTPAPEQSGLGHSSFVFDGDQLQTSEDVSVDVYFGSSKVGHGEVVIPAQNPAVVLYARDPLRGIIWDVALPSAFTLTSKEFTVAAVPYYFSRASTAGGALSYSWTLDGEDTSGPQSAQGLLTLRQTGAGQGAAQLGVLVQNNNSNQLVQAAQSALQIVFGGISSGPSLFGL